MLALNQAACNTSADAAAPATRYILCALSYRGYWTSRGRPSESGIALDAASTLTWISRAYPNADFCILWGQSLGAAVATRAAADWLDAGRAVSVNEGTTNSSSGPVSAIVDQSTRLQIKGLILETPFTSISDMLRVLYPQKWLPYRYLTPFLWNHWDSRMALGRVAMQEPAKMGKAGPRILIAQAGDDEIVPAHCGQDLEDASQQLGLQAERIIVNGALHHEVAGKAKGKSAIVQFIKGLG